MITIVLFLICGIKNKLIRYTNIDINKHFQATQLIKSTTKNLSFHYNFLNIDWKNKILS